MSEETKDQVESLEANEKFEADASEGRAGEGRTRTRRRRKVSYLTLNKIEAVDYKDIGLLQRFLSDRGKILPSRQTGTTAKQQRMVSRAVKRARELALIPFVVRDAVDTPRRPRSSQQ